MHMLMLLGLRLNRSWNNTRGQDLIEYALMAGCVVVFAGAIIPGMAGSISAIFSEVSSVISGPTIQGNEALN